MYAYGADANLSSVTLDPGAGHLNRTTTFGYTGVSDNQGNTESGLLASITDALGHTVNYQYAISYTVNGLATYTPTGTAWVSQVSEPASNQGAAATLTWNIEGDPASSGYAVSGTVVSSTGLYYRLFSDPLLRAGTGGVGNSLTTYTLTYDSANNVLSSLRGSVGSQNGYPYPDDSVNLLARRDLFTYGPHGNQLTHSVDGFAGTETTSYYNGSQYFQKASVTDMNGHTSTFGVGDKTGADPSNANLTPAPGNRGSVLWVRDAGYGVAGNPSYQKQFTYAYNTVGQKVQETNLGVAGNGGTVTSYSYGDNGDSWGNLTTVVQDPHVIQGDSHLARTTSMVYDVTGHVLNSVDPKAQQSSFVYNVLGQPTSATFPATMNGATQVTPAETVSYLYDANGRTSSVSDNRGTTTMAYEAGCDRVASVTDPVTGALSYTYGLAGNRLSMTLPGGGTWNYGYVVSNASANSLLYCRAKDDPNSLAPMLGTITDDQGRRTEYHVDAVGALHESVTNQLFSGTTLIAYQDSFLTTDQDATQQNTRKRLQQISNTYQTLNQANNQWQSKLLVSNAYSYDTAGQRLSNQLSSLDGSGNPTSRTELYSYDEQNRLKTVDYGDGQTQSYGFDAMGNRR